MSASSTATNEPEQVSIGCCCPQMLRLLAFTLAGFARKVHSTVWRRKVVVTQVVSVDAYADPAQAAQAAGVVAMIRSQVAQVDNHPESNSIARPLFAIGKAMQSASRTLGRVAQTRKFTAKVAQETTSHKYLEGKADSTEVDRLMSRIRHISHTPARSDEEDLSLLNDVSL